jgi:hypothetical protein
MAPAKASADAIKHIHYLAGVIRTPRIAGVVRGSPIRPETLDGSMRNASQPYLNGKSAPARPPAHGYASKLLDSNQSRRWRISSLPFNPVSDNKWLT